VGALGHYLEEEGIPTTQISLVREHTVALNPPRALWVPFVLGRPFGAPNDSVFQRKVLVAALRLLERETGPVLEDFPEDAPHSDLGEAPAGLNCPVSFPNLTSDGTLAQQLAEEISQLRAWHDVAVKHRKRTTLGLTGLSPEELGAFVGSWLEDNPPATFRQGIGSAVALKLATDELKTFYYEAKAAQPGRHAVAEIQDWFWLDTVAGKAFIELRSVAAKSADPSMKGLATISLVPRAVDAALQARRRV
jgi:hypothetical protein